MAVGLSGPQGGPCWSTTSLFLQTPGPAPCFSPHNLPATTSCPSALMSEIKFSCRLSMSYRLFTTLGRCIKSTDDQKTNTTSGVHIRYPCRATQPTASKREAPSPARRRGDDVVYSAGEKGTTEDEMVGWHR